MKQFTTEQRQKFIAEFNEEMKKDGAVKGDVIKRLGKKHGFGFSTFTNWLYNGKAKRKVAIKKVTKPAEKKWENLFEKYIYHRDEAAKARKELEAFVEQLR